jgi:hypothetical protein
MRGPDIKAGAAKFRADRAARAQEDFRLGYEPPRPFLGYSLSAAVGADSAPIKF